MAYRLDINGRVKSFKRTPQGGILAPAYLTRAGVFTYTMDGKPFRELRHPDEVFSKESLDSLASAPVTRRHPPEPVNPANWKDYAIGHVGESVKVDQERYVAADVRVHDAKAVGDVETGNLVEFSCGYSCDVVLERGTYDGIEYDAVQKNIRYNHVGMGPMNWGRAGTEVRLRVDGEEVVLGVPTEDAEGSSYSFGMTTPTLEDALKKVEELQGRCDASEAKVAELTKARMDAAEVTETLTKERDAAVARADAAEAQVAEIPKRVDARLSLERDARVILGAEYKADGLSDHDLRVAAIKKADASFDPEAKSQDYVAGVFASRVQAEKAATASLEKVRQDSLRAPATAPEKSALEKALEESNKALGRA